MKHVYPVRHPPLPQDAAHGETTASRDSAREPALPHEHDESSHSQASAAASHDRIGGQAYDDLAEGRQDTDKGPEMDRVYNEKVAPHRGPENPRR